MTAVQTPQLITPTAEQAAKGLVPVGKFAVFTLLQIVLALSCLALAFPLQTPLVTSAASVTGTVALLLLAVVVVA